MIYVVVVKEESKFTVENKGSRGTCLAESFDFACSDAESARQGSFYFGNNVSTAMYTYILWT